MHNIIVDDQHTVYYIMMIYNIGNIAKYTRIVHQPMTMLTK